jgi:glycerol-3-phosphate dehydrogenase
VPSTQRIAIIGAGITGACVAWELARAGHEVNILESDRAMRQTSSASSKLLHGGLRYLEQGQFRLVHEALQERKAWFADAPELAQPLQLHLPIYRQARRGKWIMALGLWLYDTLAIGSGLPGHTWIDRESLLAQDPGLRPDGLLGAYQYWDGQMDDLQLGLWVLQQAVQLGATLREHTPVLSVTLQGEIRLATGETQHYDRIILAAGPWGEDILERSHLTLGYRLDRVRGSHIVLNRPTANAYLLEVPHEKRIFFVLPWKGRTLVGTTEVRQDDPGQPHPSPEEIRYLLDAYNTYRSEMATERDITETFAGIRPLIRSTNNPSQASREYVIDQNQQLLTILGGKWTTSRALARKVKSRIENS